MERDTTTERIASFVVETGYPHIPKEAIKIAKETILRLGTTLSGSGEATGEIITDMEYCMAIALLDREVSLEKFTDKRASSRDVQELIPRVKFAHPVGGVGSPGIIHGVRQAAVTVTLRDGTRLCREMPYPKGDPDNPLTQEELVDKFRDCAHQILSVEDIERCVELVSDLESLKNITSLMKMLTAAG